MSKVITHNFAGLDTTFPIRVVELKGEPWFVAKDVCECLGLQAQRANGSYQNHYRRLDSDELALASLLDSPSGKSIRLKLISESGLYKLVMRSDKPQARLFQDWVTRDVLPAIRKDGAYVMGEEKVATGELDEDAFVLQAMNILQKKIERLREQNAQLMADNEKLLPDAQVGQAVGARKRTTVMDFARKLPGINTMQVQKTLAALGHLRKVDGRWSVYHSSKKYFNESFDGQGFSVITLTEKGMELVSRLYLEGEFPMLKGRVPEAAA